VLILYLAMTVGAFVVLRSMARRWRAGEEELPSPYGPAVSMGGPPEAGP
jgi:cytochrome d ubiquinol oxidase subunit I